MPDQSSASTEHALMQEITAPLATLPDDPLPAVADVDFPTALRGYDRLAVDAYVQRTSQLVAELQATRSPDAAVRRALERVGEEVSGILQRAHDTGARITAQSRSEAEDRLEVARREAAEIVAAAEARVRELDAETDRIWGERHRIVEDTRELAQELLSLTNSAADRFPAEATAARPDGTAEEGAVGADDVGAMEDADTREDDVDPEDPAVLEGDVDPEEAAVLEGDVDPEAAAVLEGDVEPEDAAVLEGDVEPEDIFPAEPDPRVKPDPHVEPTAILPVVEPPDHDSKSH